MEALTDATERTRLPLRAPPPHRNFIPSSLSLSDVAPTIPGDVDHLVLRGAGYQRHPIRGPCTEAERRIGDMGGRCGNPR